MPIDTGQLEGQKIRVLDAFPKTGPDLDFAVPVANGTTGDVAKRVQELLCLNGSHVTLDSEFGPATVLAVTTFQRASGLPATGVVDRATQLALVAPLLRAADPVVPAGTSFRNAVALIMNLHVGLRPIEIGGDNCGPWVRLYCRGADGASFRWCAGFVSFILEQAAHATSSAAPFAYTLSCDNLANAARQQPGRFFEGTGQQPALAAPAIFLVRHAPGDWVHTGLVSGFAPTAFTTIEGNTNEEGGSNGFEACARSRGYNGKDFIALL
jgi:hypothetical protein